MKIASRILSLILLASLATFYTSCNKGEKKDPIEKTQLTKLSSTWTMTSANDGTNRTADFPNLKLTISGTFAQGGTYNYSLTGTTPTPSPWPRNGTWKFGADPTKDIIRDLDSNQVNMEYEVTNTGLIITFTLPDGSIGWAGGTGRAKEVSGNWRFEFSKQ